MRKPTLWLLFLSMALGCAPSSLVAQSIEFRVRLIDAHSGKPDQHERVRVMGTNRPPGHGIGAPPLYDSEQFTDSTGTARFTSSAPLPLTLDFSGDFSSCPAAGGGYLSKQLVAEGVNTGYICSGKKKGLDIDQIKPQPGEIIFFTYKRRWGAW